jgi:hypothetical protein
VYLRIPLAALVLGELGSAMIVASTMEPLFSSSPFLGRRALTCLKMSSARSLRSSRWRKFRIVVS